MLLPAFPVCLFLLPLLPIDAVIHMDFRFDVTHQRQQLGEDHLTVLLEVLLDYAHLFLGLFLNFSGAAAMRSKCLQTAKERESSHASSLTKKTLCLALYFVILDCLSASQPLIFAEGRTALKKRYCWILCSDFPLNLPKFVFHPQLMPFILFYLLSISLEHELLKNA